MRPNIFYSLTLIALMAFPLGAVFAAGEVAIYTGEVNWISPEDAQKQAQICRKQLSAAGITSRLFDSADDSAALADWMKNATGNGRLDVCILYGDFPSSIYPAENALPDGSIAETFIETPDGDAFINHGDYMFWGGVNGNTVGGLQNMMDIPDITMWDDNTAMRVTAEGKSISPSLKDFVSDRPFHVDELAGDWKVEVALAQNQDGTRADPIIVRDGNRGRLIPMMQTHSDADQPYGAVAAEVITYLMSKPETPIADDRGVYMYWASWDTGSIQRATLDGRNLQNLVTGLTWPRDVALDIEGNKMYWVDAGADKVQRANLDGSGVEDLVNTQGRPFGIAVDTTNRKMYWSIWGPGKIRRANLDGTNVEDFVTGLSEPEDIDLDLSGGKIYWTDTVTNKIQRANLDGSNIEDLVTVGLSHPLCLTLDVAGGKMYWTNTSFWPGPWPGLDKIQRANLDGTNVEDLVTTGLRVATGIVLDVSGGKMYWADSGKIQRANLDGSSIEDIIVSSDDAPIGPTGIALGILQPTISTLMVDDTLADDPSLILYFSFDELNNNTVIDHSQYQNHGTLVGNPQLVAGKFGNALKLNGKSDWVEVPHHDSLTVDEAVTVMAWIHTPRYHGPQGVSWQGIVGKSNNPRSYSFYTVEDGTLHFSVDASIGSASDEKIALNEWQHVVAQVDDGWHRYWINGRNVGNFLIDAPLPGKADTASVRIGNTHDILPIPDRHFLGLIDEVRIYNRALSEAEIIEQMETGYQTIPTRIASTIGTTLSFSPSPVASPPVGQQLTLNLNITGGENVAGYQATVNFDPTALRYISSKNADYLPAGAFAVPEITTENSVTLAATSLAGESAGDGTLATVTFEVVSAKASTVTLSEVILGNSVGSESHPQVEAAEITEPEALRADINKDGVVNIQDLVLVAANFGATGENAADVNGDGVVNIADLVLVAAALGDTAASPLVHATGLEHLTATEVAQWLRAAQQANLTDPAFQRGVEILKHLLTVLVPKETVLLANYPNPFNPETWIPYQLSESADVTVSIYAVDGNLIRTLSLGHKAVGIYQNRSRAAYWDGKNEVGEPVASGVYFYTLTAGDFTATRKMLIRK